MCSFENYIKQITVNKITLNNKYSLTYCGFFSWKSERVLSIIYGEREEFITCAVRNMAILERHCTRHKERNPPIYVDFNHHDNF